MLIIGEENHFHERRHQQRSVASKRRRRTQICLNIDKREISERDQLSTNNIAKTIVRMNVKVFVFVFLFRTLKMIQST